MAIDRIRQFETVAWNNTEPYTYVTWAHGVEQILREFFVDVPLERL
jgi:hypothetical protein